MFGKTEDILIIVVIVLLLFGAKRLPDLAKSFGEGLREFKKAMSGEIDEKPATPATPTKTEEDEPAKKA